VPTIQANPTTPAGDASRDRDDSRRIDAPLPLAWWHLASLDAPTVAVVWALAFAWAARVTLPAWVPILLALVALPVYIADRLLDARWALLTGQLHCLRQRHHFHWRHRRILFPIALTSACAADLLVFRYMPVAARERNSVLAAAALAYFSGVHSKRSFPPRMFKLLAPLFAKESLVALLFTAACTLPALSRAAVGAPAQPEWRLWPLSAAVVFFTLLAWLNCHAIECWESRGQPSQDHSSEESRVIRQAILLAFAGLVLAAVLAPISSRAASLALTGATSALFLALLDRLRHRLTPVALRSAADLALLTPLALLLQ
jgi:hypothetical protein